MKEVPTSPGFVGLVARYEWIVILAISPLMLFPGRVSWIALIIIGLVWICRRLAYGRFSRPSAMNAPEALLVVMAVAGFLVSVDRPLSEPKLWGIALQAVLFFAVLNGLHGKRDVRWLAAGLVALTLATALLSLIGTQWDVVRLVDLPQIYDRLPRLLGNIPDSGLSPTQEFFHPREVGATMGLLLPFVAAMALFGSGKLLRLSAALTFLVGGLVLLLSQALMGLFGLLLGLAILAVWWRRRLAVPLILLGLVLAVLLVVAVPTSWRAAALSSDSPIGLGVILRLDMWSRAWAMIADMPYTGIGLNTFSLIQTHFYMGYLLGVEPHAHNLFLQTALDLGLPGLLAFVWLLVAFYLTARQALTRLDDRPATAMVIGAVAGVSAYVAGGLLDVMTLGAKPVAALSLLLGLTGALNWLAHDPEPAAEGDDARGRLGRVKGLAAPALFLLILIIGFALWPGSVSRNLALIPAHQAVYVARQSGRLPAAETDRAMAWLPRAIEQDPGNPELHGIYGSLLAWSEMPDAALNAFARRVLIDGRMPYRYAPFLAWQRELAGLPPESGWQTLLRVYRQWQIRFPGRAEYPVMISLIHQQHLQDSDQALLNQQQALEAGAMPGSLLEFYRALLAERTGANTDSTP